MICFFETKLSLFIYLNLQTLEKCGFVQCVTHTHTLSLPCVCIGCIVSMCVLSLHSSVYFREMTS